MIPSTTVHDDEKSARVTFWITIILVVVFFLQVFWGNLEKSLTWDEPVFISSGYTYLTRNDFRMNPEAPPLMQQLVAFPLLFLDLEAPPEEHQDWRNGSHFRYTSLFFFLNYQKIQHITFWARLPILILGVGMILVVYSWGNNLFGPIPALAGATIAAFSPNLLAHSKVATTDLGCAFFMFLSVYMFWRACRSEKRVDWVLAGLIIGLALLAKYTSLLLGPIFVVISLALIFRKEKSKSFPSMLQGNSIAALVAILVVGAGYNFSFDFPLYLRGLQNVYANLKPDYIFYLAGKFSDKPLWYYNPVALIMKVPLPILILLALSFISFFRSQQKYEIALFLLLPAFVVIGISLFDKANFGIRRVLPAFPFLFLFISLLFSQNWKNIKNVALYPLIVWLIVEAAIIFPHHLAFFNFFVGGPERGPYLLDDSNIDWGQDMPGLIEWQKEHPEFVPYKLYYFGSLSPLLYGAEAELLTIDDLMQPQEGIYAVSAHNLTSLRKLQYHKNIDSDWLSKYEPMARIGYSIYIYKFPQP